MSLPECLETLFNCNATTPDCKNSAGFDFPSLWNLTEQVHKRCPNSPWLFKQSGLVSTVPADRVALTNDVCKSIAGAGWTKYPGSDIWARLTTWKFPLFQLVANSPRPPLGFWIEAFAFLHFLGDPIGTISDLLRKLDGCQSRAMFWQDRLENELDLLVEEPDRMLHQRVWKSLAIIVDSFDEWGASVGDHAEKYLLMHLTQLCAPQANALARREYLRACLKTADALAADRSTKFVPVVIAQAFFIGSVAIAMIRTKSTGTGPSPTSYINIEMYSIAFTAQYFWVIFAVFWTSIIGTSQTAAAIPRILTRFKRDLQQDLPRDGAVIDLPIDRLDEDSRIYNGGIYSWQPVRQWAFASHNATLERRARSKKTKLSVRQRAVVATVLRFWPVMQHLLPFVVVGAAAATGQLMSALVPPVGWSCRSTSMMWMTVTWIISYVLSLIPFRNNYRLLFWVTFTKDFFAMMVNVGIIIMTQFGIYNRCDCYTQYGRVGAQLPFMPHVRDLLESRLSGAYPAVLTLGIALQLVMVPSLLVWRYHAAVQVFLQRDDGESNLDWWYSFARWATRKKTGKGVALDVSHGSAATVGVTGPVTLFAETSDAEKGNADVVEEIEHIIDDKPR